LRVEIDHRNEKMGAKIRDFTLQKLPYILIVGDKETETGAISLRVRGLGDKGGMPLEDFVGRARSIVDSKSIDL
jgi:threonyl-tRNA synthetase